MTVESIQFYHNTDNNQLDYFHSMKRTDGGHWFPSAQWAYFIINKIIYIKLK